MKTWPLWWIVLSCLCLASPAARAESPELPDAAALLDQAVEAMGGRAAMDQIHNRVTHGSMQIPAMGITGTLVSYSAAPSLFYSVAELAGLGKFESGTDGEIFWESTAMTGPRLKSGEERAMALREARFNGMLHWREMYADARTVGIDTVESRPCHKILLTPVEGSPETQYYDMETGLLRKAEMTITGEMGTIPVVAYADDYREVDGVQIRSRQVVMGIQEMLFVTERVEHNVEIPEGRFEPPAEIRALLERDREAEAPEAAEQEPPAQEAAPATAE